jgi:hypothetical protein
MHGIMTCKFCGGDLKITGKCGYLLNTVCTNCGYIPTQEMREAEKRIGLKKTQLPSFEDKSSMPGDYTVEVQQRRIRKTA